MTTAIHHVRVKQKKKYFLANECHNIPLSEFQIENPHPNRKYFVNHSQPQNRIGENSTCVRKSVTFRNHENIEKFALNRAHAKVITFIVLTQKVISIIERQQNKFLRGL